MTFIMGSNLNVIYHSSIVPFRGNFPEMVSLKTMYEKSKLPTTQAQNPLKRALAQPLVCI